MLSKRFGDLQVARFTSETVLAHVRDRKADSIANATINRELDIIRGVLKKAKRWHLFADEIKPLPLRQSVGRALSCEGKLKLLKTALRPEWQNAALGCAPRSQYDHARLGDQATALAGR